MCFGHFADKGNGINSRSLLIGRFFVKKEKQNQKFSCKKLDFSSFQVKTLVQSKNNDQIVEKDK